MVARGATGSNRTEEPVMDQRARPTASFGNETKQTVKDAAKDMREITDKELASVSGGQGSVLAGNVSSQAEQKLEWERKDLTRNWAG
jgi:bacteriocin-like protein